MSEITQMTVQQVLLANILERNGLQAKFESSPAVGVPDETISTVTIQKDNGNGDIQSLITVHSRAKSSYDSVYKSVELAIEEILHQAMRVPHAEVVVSKENIDIMVNNKVLHAVVHAQSGFATTVTFVRR